MASFLVHPPLQSGYLLVNKPKGPSSYDMIRWIKRIVNNVKIGHCGTLDPLAEGLLVILLGKATKEQDKFMGADKVYLCRVQLGLKTDSGDLAGKIIEEKKEFTFPSKDDIQSALQFFLGEHEQTPPMYSALKHEGTPLYKLARQGKTIERKPRKITIRKIELTNMMPPNEFEFRVNCSTGTYIRTLAEDIGARLGLPSTMSGLVREVIGSFSVLDAVPGDRIKEITADQLWTLVKPIS